MLPTGCVPHKDAADSSVEDAVDDQDFASRTAANAASEKDLPREEEASGIDPLSSDVAVEDASQRLSHDFEELQGEVRPLTIDFVCAALSGLGHNDSGNIVFTTVTLSNLSLNSIECLSKFRYLQRCVMDNNKISNSSPLRFLSSLVHFSACHNQLDSTVFESLRSSCETLQFVDVSSNQITTLESLGSFSFLNEVHADNNEIHTLGEGVFGGCTSLRTLTLSSNKMISINAKAFLGCPIRTLDLSSNLLGDLEPLNAVKETLTSLNVSNNSIMHFSMVSMFTRLTSLDLTGNNAYDISEVYSLAQLPALRSVHLLGNPLCSLSLNGESGNSDYDVISDVVRDDVAVSTSKQQRKPPLVHGTLHIPAPNSEKAASANEVVLLPPEEENKRELAQQPLDAQYRLRVLWRAPNLTYLDGVRVTPEESARSQNLEGGADKTVRQKARSTFLVATGNVTQTVRNLRAM